MTEAEALAAALVILARKGVPTDWQEALVYGNDEIEPGALQAVLNAPKDTAKLKVVSQWT